MNALPSLFEIKRVPSREPCWRLVIWTSYDRIEEIIEFASYKTLRGFAKNRGCSTTPTQLQIDKAVTALGGWSKVDDERDSEYSLTWKSDGALVAAAGFLVKKTWNGKVWV